MFEKTVQRTKHKVIAKYKHNGWGIVSGPHNPASVGCNMYVLEDGESATTFVLNRYHQGHEMLAHGGITAAILDEVLGYANHAREYVLKLKYTPMFTGTVTYSYIRPVKVGERYNASALVYRIEGRKRFVKGAIFDDEGNCYVRADGVYFTEESLEDINEIVKFQDLSEDDPKEI